MTTRYKTETFALEDDNGRLTVVHLDSGKKFPAEKDWPEFLAVIEAPDFDDPHHAFDTKAQVEMDEGDDL